MNHLDNAYDKTNDEQGNTETDTQSMFLFRQVTRVILTYYVKYMVKEPCHTSQRTGHMLV